MNCKLCETKMLPLYAYPHGIPEVIPFKSHERIQKPMAWGEPGSYLVWRDVNLYICPKCGHVQGEVLTDEMEQQ